MREDCVSEVLEDLLKAVCKKADYDSRRWRCPGGCAVGALDCARAAFRLQCVPTGRVCSSWASARVAYGPSGYKYGIQKQQEFMRREPGYADAFRRAAYCSIAQICRAILTPLAQNPPQSEPQTPHCPTSASRKRCERTFWRRGVGSLSHTSTGSQGIPSARRSTSGCTTAAYLISMVHVTTLSGR